MKEFQPFCDALNRRQFIKQASIGLGAAALSGLTNPLAGAPHSGMHFPARAKRVIFLFMAGAPSQLDLFDHKPNLDKLHGQPLPPEISRGQRVTTMTRGKKQVISSRRMVICCSSEMLFYGSIRCFIDFSFLTTRMQNMFELIS